MWTDYWPTSLARTTPRDAKSTDACGSPGAESSVMSPGSQALALNMSDPPTPQSLSGNQVNRQSPGLRGGPDRARRRPLGPSRAARLTGGGAIEPDTGRRSGKRRHAVAAVLRLPRLRCVRRGSRPYLVASRPKREKRLDRRMPNSPQHFPMARRERGGLVTRGWENVDHAPCCDEPRKHSFSVAGSKSTAFPFDAPMRGNTSGQGARHERIRHVKYCHPDRAFAGQQLPQARRR
jgi:hypothetical protein